MNHVYYDTDKFTAQLLEEIGLEDPRKKDDDEKPEKDSAQALTSSAIFLASSFMALVHLF